MEEVKMVVEGVFSAKAAMRLAEKYHVRDACRQGDHILERRAKLDAEHIRTGVHPKHITHEC